MDHSATLATIRFGFGRRGADPLPADPVGWLRSQLSGPDAGPPGPSLADGMAAVRQDREARPPPGAPRAVGTLFRAECDALAQQALTTSNPFRERLVWFWANHFTLSNHGGPGVAATAGDFVRSAIRPHVTGRFADMLLAVMRHPAMLIYLNNAESAGPDSVIGMRQDRGLNENLARECLELHTLSPAAGYTQADVTAFARVLTGWSVAYGMKVPAGFLFRPAMHEPGEQTLLGRRFPDGQAGGEAALLFVANHPATYDHLARKLARHFVADEPPPAVVRRVAEALRATGGDLAAAAAVLVELPEAWAPLTKLRAPQDFVLATLRAADLPADRRPSAVAAMRQLGQPLFGAPLPNGWADRAAEWAGPEAMMRRVDWAYAVAGHASEAEPEAMAQAVLGPLASPATLAAMRAAGSRRDALSLLYTSPEFQRR